MPTKVIKNLTRRLILVTSLTVIALVTFGATARAADVVASDDASWLDIARPVYDAFSGGHYAFAAAALVIAICALLKRYAGTGKVGSFVHSDAGGSLLALLAAGGTAVTAGLATPGATVTWGLMKAALLVGVGAAGGYAVIKNLFIDPILKPLAAKYTWLSPVLAIASFIFDKPDTIAKAQKAGDAAVVEKPAQGAAAVIGKPADLK